MPARGVVSVRDADAHQEEQTVPAFDALELADSGASLVHCSMGHCVFKQTFGYVYALPFLVHALANGIVSPKRGVFHSDKTAAVAAIVRKAVAA